MQTSLPGGLEGAGRSACDCGLDVHSHFVPHDFPSYLGSRAPARWPSMVPANDCHRSVMIEGKLFRTVSDKAWNAARRLADLPGMGLTRQALSPMPELLSYWMSAEDAGQLLRFLNEEIAAAVDRSAGALLGLGAVPLQDIDLAIGELRYVRETLGFAGVEIGSNIDGIPIGDARFLPFFEACRALDAAVFVHAVKPTGMDRLVGPPQLQQVLGYPTDVGLAAASVITSNLLMQLPGLRIAFSHGGGTLASLLPRLQQGWKVFPPLRSAVERSPVEQARGLWFDTLVFDAATLRHLAGTFGADRLMIGTDYPFNFGDPTPVARIREAGFDEATTARLAHLNAETFLGLNSGGRT